MSRGQRAWKPFPTIQDVAMMPQIYEDVVLKAVLTPTQWQNTPRILCNGLHGASADTRTISHFPRGKRDVGVRPLILIRSASFPHLLSSRPEVSSFESAGPSMIFNSLFLTSNDKQHHLLSFSSALPLSGLLSLLSL